MAYYHGSADFNSFRGIMNKSSKDKVSKLIDNTRTNPKVRKEMYTFLSLIDRDIDEDRYIQPYVVDVAFKFIDSEIQRLEELK